jgi:hypothetical protein
VKALFVEVVLSQVSSAAADETWGTLVRAAACVSPALGVVDADWEVRETAGWEAGGTTHFRQVVCAGDGGVLSCGGGANQEAGALVW